MIHARNLRHKGYVSLFLLKLLQITFSIPRISLKVLRRSELDRIHKDTYGSYIIFLFRCSHKTEMTFMKCPHGWHKANCLTLLQMLLSSLPHDRRYPDYFHCEISCINSSKRSFSFIFLIIFPFRKRIPIPLPPAMPISASLASPGPFKTQPITAIFIGLLIFLSLYSTSVASFVRSIPHLPQVGQDTISAPFFLSPRDLSISYTSL